MCDLFKSGGQADLDNNALAELLNLASENAAQIGPFKFFASYSVFVKKLTYLVQKLPDDAHVKKHLLEKIQAVSKSEMPQAQRYEVLVDGLYEILQIGFDAVDQWPAEKNPRKWANFDAVLPIIYYLSSPENPFARENLFSPKMTKKVEEKAVVELSVSELPDAAYELADNFDEFALTRFKELSEVGGYSAHLSDQDLPEFHHFLNLFVYTSLDAAAKKDGSYTKNGFIKSLIGKQTSDENPLAEGFKLDSAEISTVETREQSCVFQ